MHDTSAMSTFEKYVHGLSLLTADQLAACKKAQDGLRELGLPKSLEEIAIRLGVLDSPRLGEILADIKKKWNISIPRPVIYEVSEADDKALQEKLVLQSPQQASRVLESREIRERAAPLGVTLKVAEILIAKGYYTPPSAEPSIEDLLPDEPAPPPKAAPPIAPRKAVPAARKPAAPAAKRPAPPRKEEAPSEPAQKSKKMLWIGVGAGAALVLLVVIVLIATSKPDAPPPEVVKEAPKVTGKQTLLFAEGFDTIPLYSESSLLAWHAGKPPKADVSVAVNTPVTLRSFLRTEKSLWYFVRTPKGVEGWVNSAQVKANFDLASLALQDFGAEWADKLADAKGLPRPVAKVAEKPPTVAPPTPAPKPVVKEPEPAAKPEPEPDPAKPDPAPAPPPAPKNPVAGIWKFDEGSGIRTEDASGNDNPGSLGGGVAWVDGPFGKALVFDGVDDYVSCPVGGMPAASGAQTIAAWFHQAAVPSTVQQLVCLCNEDAKSGVHVGFRDSKLAVWKFGGSVLVSAAAPAPGAWHHVAYTFDGTTHRLYVDGAVAATSTAAPSSSLPNRLEFGRWEGIGIKEYFKGMMDEVRIYARAMSDPEIRDLVPAGGIARAPGVKPPAPPKAGDAARETREKKAQALWDLADKLEKEGKIAEAQERLRELRTRYRSTSLYFDKMIEITDRINDLGQKVAAAALVKTASYKRPHMDAWWSFEFVPPEGWKGVPSQPNLVGEQDNDESFYKGRTYQIARYNAPYLDKLYVVILKTFACTGLDNLESKVTGELEERFKGLKEQTRTAPAGRMPYVRKTYLSNDGDRIAVYYYFADRKGIALAGVWRAGGDGLYVSITTFGPDGKSTRKSSDRPVTEGDFAAALKVFDQSARTFWIYDAAARAGKRTSLGIGGSLCSDWSTLTSSKGNYIIEYATRQDFAKRCGEEMEQIQALYRHVIPTQKPIPPCRIKIFDREEDFKDYSGALGAAAYWSPMQAEIVGYRFEGDKLKLDSNEEMTIAEDRNPEEVTFKILYHEGFHQYMHYYMGSARSIYVPSWLNEGMGDYFFGGEWNKTRNKFTIGINDWRIRKIHAAVKKNEHVPLDKIFRYEQRDYYRDAGLCYAEGWSINYFFQMSDVARKRGYGAIPKAMMEELKASGNWEKATDKIFGALDLKKMEEEWKEYVLSLPVPKEKPEDDPFK